MEQYLEKDEDKDRFLLDLGRGRSRAVHAQRRRAMPRSLRKTDLKALLDAIMQLEALDRTLQRKSTSMREYLALRAADPQRRLAIGLFTDDNQKRHFAFDKEEYERLEDAVIVEDKPEEPPKKAGPPPRPRPPRRNSPSTSRPKSTRTTSRTWPARNTRHRT